MRRLLAGLVVMPLAIAAVSAAEPDAEGRPLAWSVLAPLPDDRGVAGAFAGVSGGDQDDGALVVAGGVAANQAIRGALASLAAAQGLPFIAPPMWLCTDNGAMIAWAGVERLVAGDIDDLPAPARPRWPLDPAAEAVRGAGVKA